LELPKDFPIRRSPLAVPFAAPVLSFFGRFRFIPRDRIRPQCGGFRAPLTRRPIRNVFPLVQTFLVKQQEKAKYERYIDEERRPN